MVASEGEQGSAIVRRKPRSVESLAGCGVSEWEALLVDRVVDRFLVLIVDPLSSSLIEKVVADRHVQPVGWTCGIPRNLEGELSRLVRWEAGIGQLHDEGAPEEAALVSGFLVGWRARRGKPDKVSGWPAQGKRVSAARQKRSRVLDLVTIDVSVAPVLDEFLEVGASFGGIPASLEEASQFVVAANELCGLKDVRRPRISDLTELALRIG